MIKPPIVGPSKGPIKAGMITKFIALSNSDLSKVRTIKRRPTGIMSAAATPCNTREAINISRELDMPHKNDAKVNKATALAKTRREPNRSAIQPLSVMHTAKLSK